MQHYSLGFPNYIWFLRLCVWTGALLLCIVGGDAVKIRYASTTECDRYSVDAVYNEKFKVITENIFKDSVEFVSRISDLAAESLTMTMSKLPDRDSSDNEDRKIFTQFKNIKNAFSSKVKKVHKNITATWETLANKSFDLMYDNGKSSLEEYLKNFLSISEAYSESRKSLDSNVGSFITFIKSIVRDGLQGISLAADDSLKKEAAEKSNSTEEEKQDTNKDENPEDKLLQKKLEIIDMVVSGFLGKVTVEVVKQNIDLFKKVTVSAEDRESVLEDMLFDILMIKSRLLAIIHSDIPKEKGSIDLARRSIYTYWADQAEEMYKEKIKSKQTTSPGGDLYYKNLWSDEKELMDTLLSLMEVYP